MRATQSSTASWTWCRSEQFAALRYINQHRAGAELSPLEAVLHAGLAASEETQPIAARGYGIDSLVGVDPGAGISDAEMLAEEAGELLRAMRPCNHMLADVGVSSAERTQLLAELNVLKNRTEALTNRFLRHSCPETKGGTTRPAEAALKLLEQGAAGWITY